MRLATRVVGAAVLAGIAGLLAPRASAGTDEQLVLHPRDDEARIVEVRVRWGLPGGALTGWGWVRVDVGNKDKEAQTVTLSVDGNGMRPTRRVLTVPAGGRATTWLPRLPGQGSDQLMASAASGGQAQSYDYGGNEMFRLLVLGSPSATKATTDALQKAVGPPAGAGSRAASVRIWPTTAEEIPDRWTCLTAASVVVIDAGSSGLDAAEPQRTLAQYLCAGGALLILRPASLPAGPLKALLTTDAPPFAAVHPAKGLTIGQHGLGRWWGIDDPEATPAAIARVADEWARKAVLPARPGVYGGTGMPAALAPEGFLAGLEIPGLGEVPVRLFFFLILGFAILVGPVAYLTLKRRRRLSRMLWLVPAAGLGFAGAILLYGLLSEGLGTKGAVRSLTILDQRTHDAWGAAHRTLFAGLAPSDLRLSPDTLVHSVGFSFGWGNLYEGRASRIVLDLDAGTRILGDALPSRTPTTFSTVTQGRARERLRFKRLPDGRYEVLSSDGFEPVDAPGSLVLHAPDGTWHVGEGRGKPLRIETPDGAASVLRTLRETVSKARLQVSEDEDRRGPGFRYLLESSREEADAFLPETERFTEALTDPVPPGAYLGWMTSAPAFDGFGLEVRWLVARHLVLGLLAPEDVDG